MLSAVVIVLAPLATPIPIDPIVGGSEVGTCGWASVVALDGTCSGTLIHPQVVLYAAHCGPNVHFVTPGEVEAEGTPVDAECTVNPAWDHEAGGSDFAVCVLADPIEDVAIVPILMGCEHQVLAEGVPATSVAFGLAPDGPAGIKRAVTYAIDDVVLDEGDVWVGGADGSLCDGDSGGGAFVQWIDGSWRLFGVHSAVAGTPCTDDKALLTLASGAVPWIEELTGFDVTPCHDADGTWNPGSDCGALPMDPAAGGGAWPVCEPGPLGGPSSACGAPSYGPEDLAAPTVTITAPRDGAVIPLDGELAQVDVAIEAVDDGWGIERTWLRIDGTDVPDSDDGFPPWELPTIALPEGMFSIEAVARDWAGNEGTAIAMIAIGDPPVPGGGSTGGDANGESSDGIADTTDATTTNPGDADDTTGDASSAGGSPKGEPGPDGCACTADPTAPRGGIVFLLALFVLPVRAGRRYAPPRCHSRADASAAGFATRSRHHCAQPGAATAPAAARPSAAPARRTRRSSLARSRG